MTITELLRELGVRYVAHGEHHHVTEGWIGIDCPYCSWNTGRFRLGIPLRSKTASCWTCGKHRLADALALASGKDLSDCIRLVGRTDKSLPTFQDDRRGRLVMPNGVGKLWPKHRDYLRKRGYDPEELERVWGIQGIGPSVKHAWRLFIPITLDGEIVSWTTRAVTKYSEEHPEIRYKTASANEESVPSKRVLYGADLAYSAITVHEGPFDAWRIGPGGTATLGVSYTDAQLLAISKFPRRVICFDAETEAQKRAIALCERLAAFPGETCNVTLSTGKDTSRAAENEVRKVRALIE